MNKVILLLFLLVLGLSCQPKKQIDGVWVLAYSQFISERDTFYSNECRFLSIKGNRFKYLEYIQPGYQIETVKSSGKFVKNGNRFVFNEYSDYSLELISIDSENLIFGNQEQIQVYKKLPLTYFAPEWNPVGKNYSFIGNKGQAYFEFINDSLMLEYNKRTVEFEAKNWWLEEFEGYKFLVLNQTDVPQPILIDSVDNEFVFISTYDTEINNYPLREFPKNDITEKLEGNWVRLYEGLPPPFPESMIFQFETFSVTADSVFAGNSTNPIKEKWLQTASGEKILFPTAKSKRWRYWKILELKEDTIALDMPDVFVLDRPGISNENRVLRFYTRSH